MVEVEMEPAMDLNVIICPTSPEVPMPEPAGKLVIFNAMVETGPRMALANIGGSQNLNHGSSNALSDQSADTVVSKAGNSKSYHLTTTPHSGSTCGYSGQSQNYA